MKRVLFEVDAGPVIGMGHLSRCLVLARALAALGCSPIFRVHGMEAASAVAPFALADAGLMADAVIVDRYSASADDIAALRACHGPLLVFDDHAERAVTADILLNGNYYARDLDYHAFGLGTALLGPEYALVTREFVDLRASEGEPGEILMTFGLSRLSGLLPALACALAEAMPDHHFRAIVPPAYRTALPLPDRVTVLEPAPLARLIGPASLIVCGLGVSWLEMVASGRLVAGTRLVDNQDLMLDALHRDGLPVAAEPMVKPVLEAIECARTGGEALFAPLRRQLDGAGPDRVARELIARVA